MLNETFKGFQKQKKQDLSYIWKKITLAFSLNFPNGAKAKTEDVTMIQVRANVGMAVEVAQSD